MNETFLAARLLALKRFDIFVRAAWSQVEPAQELVWGKHLDAICEHLQAVADGQIRNLIITMPPRHGKSTILVLWSAWMMLRNAAWRQISASYDMKLAVRDNTKTRELLQSAWCQSIFQPKWEFTTDQNTKSWYRTSLKGYRMATSITAASATGWGGNNILIDDPLAAEMHPSADSLAKMADWYTYQMHNRVENPRTSTRVIVQQRLHEMDLVGVVKAKFPGVFEHLNLMSEYESERRCETKIGWSDWRKEEGELLWPEWFGREQIEEEKSIGAYRWHAQHQQNPTPEHGGLFTMDRINFWTRKKNSVAIPYTTEEGKLAEHEQIELPDESEMEIVVQSWDCALKGTATAANTAGQIWAKCGNKFFLLHAVAEKMWADDVEALVLKFRKKWPTTSIFIEDKAVGPEVIHRLQTKHGVSGIEAINPRKGKLMRAQSIRGLMSEVYLPHPHEHPWVSDFMREIVGFPRVARNDQVDAMTQAISQMAMIVPTKKRKFAVGSA